MTLGAFPGLVVTFKNSISEDREKGQCRCSYCSSSSSSTNRIMSRSVTSSASIGRSSATASAIAVRNSWMIVSESCATNRRASPSRDSKHSLDYRFRATGTLPDWVRKKHPFRQSRARAGLIRVMRSATRGKQSQRN